MPTSYTLTTADKELLKSIAVWSLRAEIGDIMAIPDNRLNETLRHRLDYLQQLLDTYKLPKAKIFDSNALYAGAQSALIEYHYNNTSIFFFTPRKIEQEKIEFAKLVPHKSKVSYYLFKKTEYLIGDVVDNQMTLEDNDILFYLLNQYKKAQAKGYLYAPNMSSMSYF